MPVFKKKTTLNQRREMRERIGVGVSSLSLLISAATLGLAMGFLNEKPKARRSKKNISKNEKNRKTLRLFRGNEMGYGGEKYRREDYPLIAIDESGKMAKYKKNDKSMKTFSIVASKTDERKKMKEISSTTSKRRKTVNEVKYIDLREKEAKTVYHKLDKMNFKYAEKHVSRSNPLFNNDESISEYYINTVKALILELNSGEKIDILIDIPSINATKKLEDMCHDLMKDDKLKIEWFEVISSKNSTLLQTHDYITGAVGDMNNGRKPKGNADSVLPKKEIKK